MNEAIDGGRGEGIFAVQDVSSISEAIGGYDGGTTFVPVRGGRRFIDTFAITSHRIFFDK